MELENDPRNTCVGCGPANERGLQLAFDRADRGAATTFEATKWREGWPKRLHSGILYTAMLETANWSLYAQKGRVGLPIRTSGLDAKRWVETGERLRIEGREDAPVEGEDARIVVEARDARGQLVATIARGYALPTRAEFLKRMGYDVVPPELDEGLPP